MQKKDGAGSDGTAAQTTHHDPMVALNSAFNDLKASQSEMSLNDERDLGETVALQAYATPGFGAPMKNKKLMRFVNSMAAVIGRQSDRPLIPYFVAVIDTDKINAFATPGGYIFVTRGAIQAMSSEGELACVIGHEIAHITRKHALDTIKRTKMFSAGGKTLAALTDSDPDAFDKMIKDCCSQLLNNAFDAKKEIDADVTGVEYARRAGYDPRSMLRFLDALDANHALLMPGLAAHPPTRDRKKAINDRVAKYKPAELQGLVSDTPRFKTVKSWLTEPQEAW